MMQGKRTELEGPQNRLCARYCTSEHHKGCGDMGSPDATHGIACGRQLHGAAVLQLCTARHYLPVAAGPGMPSGAWMQRQPRAESRTRCDAKGTASAAGALSNGKAVVHVPSGTALWLTVLDMMEGVLPRGSTSWALFWWWGAGRRGGGTDRLEASSCATASVSRTKPPTAVPAAASAPGTVRREAASAASLLKLVMYCVRGCAGDGERDRDRPRRLRDRPSVSLQQTETCAACAATSATASGAALGPAAGCKPRQVLSD